MLAQYLEGSLRWRNIAPTCPDTLGCYPFQDDDPFIMDACPHVYFAGNQREFGTKLVKGPLEAVLHAHSHVSSFAQGMMVRRCGW